MSKIDSYFESLEELHSYFGYVEDWRVFPTVDERHMYWYINSCNEVGESTRGEVVYSECAENLIDEENDGNWYVGEIYTNRFLLKWVYESDDGKYTMALIATGCDGNIYFTVLDNTKKVK